MRIYPPDLSTKHFNALPTLSTRTVAEKKAEIDSTPGYEVSVLSITPCAVTTVSLFSVSYELTLLREGMTLITSHVSGLTQNADCWNPLSFVTCVEKSAGINHVNDLLRLNLDMNQCK